MNETAAANSTTTADAVAENATVSDTSASPSPTPKTARRTLRFALIVTPAPADESAVGSVVHYGPSERAASSVTLADLAARDEAKRAVERAKSTLEAFVYSSRDRLDAASSDEESDLLTVSTPEQREGVSSALSEAESWLYDDGATADVAAYEAKLETVQALVNPLLRRADEFGRRPRVINETRALISGIADAIAAWNSTHPQVRVWRTCVWPRA
jgi:hypoxia up-regulated 1